MDGDVLSGWAVDLTQPKEGVRLILLVDDVEVATFECVHDRADVTAYGYPGARAGFRATIPASYWDGATHTLRVVFRDATPVVFLCGGGEPSEVLAFNSAPGLRLIGHVDGIRDGSIVGWAVRQDPGSKALFGPVTLQVSSGGQAVTTVVADLPRDDVAAHLGGDGRHGFKFRPPAAFLDGMEHRFEIGTPVTAETLTNSPIAFCDNGEPQAPRYVCCSAGLLADPADFYDPPDLLSDLQAQVGRADFITDLEMVFPRYGYRRPRATTVSPAGSSGFLDEVQRYYDAVNDRYGSAPASHLVKLNRVYVCNNRIFHIEGDTVQTVYETARPPDRPFTQQGEWTATKLRRSALTVAEAGPLFYLGSAGFVNYGHFLIDDLPRAAAAARVAAHAGGAKVLVVAPGANDVLNAAKLEALKAMEGSWIQDRILFIPHDKPVYFETLYYATPVSYHPHLKSADAGAYLRERLVGLPPSRYGDRLYVPRRVMRGRTLLNDGEILNLLQSRGFSVVDVEAMSFAEQASAFGAASVVVGSMGAGMTNTVFCAPGSQVLYLTPVGWLEPFYWDLAAICQHKYTALFGTVAEVRKDPHKQDFSIDPDLLVQALDDMERFLSVSRIG